MKISDFIGAKQSSKVKKVEKLSEGKNNTEKRDLEVHLLKPAKIPEYTGKKPSKFGLARKTVKIVFITEEDFEMFSRHFKVLEYVEKSVKDISLLMMFLKSLDSGRIREKNGKLVFRKRKHPGRISKMGEGKQGTSRKKRRVRLTKNI